MCGIVGGIAERNITPILLEGLRRLEYRGYDSAGIALLTEQNKIQRQRSLGKIINLEKSINQLDDFQGQIGIAHTRWATHGKPAENNAHPHICNNQVAVVHNGIIENHAELKQQQIAQGYQFTSETDTEVIAHAIYQENQQTQDLFSAVQNSIKTLEGAYAIAVMAVNSPDTLIVARKGSPLVIGIGFNEHYIASDVSALLPVTQTFVFLEEGDIARVQRDQIEIFGHNGKAVERAVKISSLSANSVELGKHRHFMHKEIFEQPEAVANTLVSRITDEDVLISAFGHQAENIFGSIDQVQIIACGTSYHSGLTAKYWIEDILQIPCSTEVASEYRYRNPVVSDNTLFVTISQSGETADTLAALQKINRLKAQNSALNIPTLSICNVPESSLTRESDLTFLTHAGPEIGVASTKAFTTQLVALALMTTAIGKTKGSITKTQEQLIVDGLQKLPGLIKDALKHEDVIKNLATVFTDKHNALFLGRGTMYPIAMEGALKLKEISYIHAEAYPAGELKHGPLALIDDETPVVAIAPNDDLLDKLKSNLKEVKARGGKMIVFEDKFAEVESEDGMQVIKTTSNVGRITAPITLNIPLQLLSYHVALNKGTDVDQPRNLAKSVTVE